MKYRLLMIATAVLLLPLAGCVGGGVIVPWGLAPCAPWAPPTVEAPHSRFHPVPTRPVFAPPHVTETPALPVTEPTPLVAPEPELPQPVSEPPLMRSSDAAPLLLPPQNRRPEATASEPAEPRRLDPPGPLPPASSRRIARDD